MVSHDVYKGDAIDTLIHLKMPMNTPTVPLGIIPIELQVRLQPTIQHDSPRQV